MVHPLNYDASSYVSNKSTKYDYTYYNFEVIAQKYIFIYTHISILYDQQCVYVAIIMYIVL